MNRFVPERVTKLIDTAPWPPTIRAARRRRDRHGFDRVLTRTNGREEPVRRLVEVVLIADAVQGDVQERLRQAVDGGVAAGLSREIDTRKHVTPPSSRSRVGVGICAIWSTFSVEVTVAVWVLISTELPPLTVTFSVTPPTSRVALTFAGTPAEHANIGDDRGLESLERHA